MRKIQFILSVLFCVVLFTSTAFAFGEIRYTDRPLNLRDGRSPKAGWIGNMYSGQRVRIAHLKDGWVAVYEPDAVDGSESAAAGFANVKYLKKKRTRYEPKEWGELKYVVRALNVRSRPDIKGKKIMTLKSWEHVRVDFPSDDWIMVFKPTATIRSKMNAIGYSSAKYFRSATEKTKASVGFNDKGESARPAAVAPALVEQDAPATDASSADTAETVSGQGQVSGSVVPPPAEPEFVPPRLVQVNRKINIREARTSGSSLVRTLKSGDRVKVGLPRQGWYAVYGEHELVHALSHPMGYALQTLVDKGAETVAEAPEAAPVTKPEPVAVQPVSALQSDSAVAASKVVPEPKPTPEPKVAPESKPAPEPKVAPKLVPASSASEKRPLEVSSSDKGQQTMVIDRNAFSGEKRPDPVPNKVVHGYKYRFLEKSETRKAGELWITLKVFLATTKLPGRKALEDFATTLWKEHRRVTKKVAVLIYLPGMDTEDLAYGVVKFDDDKMLELWVRKATLFGTSFL